MTKKHGTRSAYSHGCRCAKCTKAHAAWTWASRQVNGWDKPVRAIFAESASVNGGKIIIPTEVLLAAFVKFTREIGIEALSEIWRRKQKSSASKTRLG